MIPDGVGVTLEQVQPDATIRPVGYASRALTKAQCNWDASRLEAYALVFGLRTFRWALSPAFTHVFVTDHHALRWLRDCVKEETAGHRQLMRFALEIEQSGPYCWNTRHVASGIMTLRLVQPMSLLPNFP